MKYFVLAALAVMLSGCENKTWIKEDGVCITPEEKQKAAEIAKSFFQNTPRSLSGNDQDLDDAISTAAYQSRIMYCSNSIS